MSKLGLGDVKAYIGLDGEEQNKLLSEFLEVAEHIVEKVLRDPIPDEVPPVVKIAVLFAVWQLYFHRDNKEFDTGNLEKTLAVMLSDLRRVEF